MKTPISILKGRSRPASSGSGGRLCCPRSAPDSQSRSTGDSARRRRLPTQMIRQASTRLKIVTLVVTVIAAIGLAINLLAPRLGLAWESYQTCAITDSTMLGASLLVFWLSRRLAPERLLNIGLLYQIGIAYGLALAEVFQPIDPDAVVHGISWVCVWIVVYPLIVPSPPKRAIAAAFAAATMGPLALWVTVQGGNPLPPPGMIVRLFGPNYIAAAIAIVPAIVLHRLGSDLNRAEELGSYRLVERLGEGGMGEVWRAKHRRLARPAAIKLVRPEVLGQQNGEEIERTIARFEREAQATAVLTSPHTIKVYDFGTTDDGVFFYVMEMLDGLDLETLVGRFGPLSPERTINFLIQACDSLAEAHQRGMTHRDIKPANIYVCRSGMNYDFIKILDFGLVKTRTSEESPHITQEGITTGTPAYMAPEIATGNAEVDGRSDIYALGCVAYWLLTGELVFDGPTGMQIALQHINATPVPPSARSEIEIPESLERIILACLEKDPERRPQTAEELGRMLQESQLEATWSNARARHWWSTHLPEHTVAQESILTV